jgi:type VI secretion system ImpA family protein
MPSPPLLTDSDFESLLAPISPEKPAGETLPYEVRTKLDEFRKVVEGAERPEDNKEAEWDKVIELAKGTLSHTAKHLRPAARLTEALVRQPYKDKILGYAGLRDGLRLLRRLVEECWDRLLPALDEEDALELRAADLNWLDDKERGALFPNHVKMVPLFGAKPQYSLMDLEGSQKSKGPLTWAEVEKAIRASKPDDLRLAAEDMAESYKELDLLIRSANAKMAAAAPGLNNLRQSVEESTTKLKQIVERYLPAAAVAASPPTGNGAPAAGTVAGLAAPPPALVTRDDCYRQMEEAAKLLRKLEPHSPIPYLVQRAIDLGKMEFPQLIKDLIKEATVLKDLNRLLGIKEEDPKKKPAASED